MRTSSSGPAVLLVVLLLASAGGRQQGDGSAAAEVASETASAEGAGATATARARPAQGLEVERLEMVPPSIPGLPPQVPRFTSEIRRVRPAEVRHSWRAGCPVGRNRLRHVSVTHWGFDGSPRRGALIVRAGQARPIVRVMRRLFEVGYPIRRMRLIDAYRGDDDASMAANNTSAFNCRRVAGTSRWSEHAYGRAIDINPVQNPYVSASGAVSPPRGRRFVNRSLRHPAIIRSGDPVVRAFASIGWRWGGHWTSAKDYQHFSLTGR